jgi:hypothetical protein
MRAVPVGLVLLTLAVAGAVPGVAWSAEVQPGAVPAWEYRVLTRDQVLELGKQDLAAGLNKLGGEGWELAAVDAVYIFKRPKDWGVNRLETAKGQVAMLESELVLLQERVAWSERMVKKGYMTEQRYRAEQAALKRLEIALDQARKELKALTGEQTTPAEKGEKGRPPG